MVKYTHVRIINEYHVLFFSKMIDKCGMTITFRISFVLYSEAANRGVLSKKVFLEISQNSQENTCAACNFIKKEALAQVFSCESCEISKNTFLTEHLWWLLLNIKQS